VTVAWKLDAVKLSTFPWKPSEGFPMSPTRQQVVSTTSRGSAMSLRAAGGTKCSSVSRYCARLPMSKRPDTATACVGDRGSSHARSLPGASRSERGRDAVSSMKAGSRSSAALR